MHIWITGASTGIGAELALRYAKNGHTVYASARGEQKLQALQSSAAAMSGDIIPVPCDVTDNESVGMAVTQILSNSNTLDLAILNAGYYEPIEFEALSLEHFEKTYDVNLRGLVRCLLPALEQFKRQANGHVAIVSSVSGYRGLPKAAAYGSSKAALINLAESLKPECNANGIKLSLVNPGFVKSPLTDLNDFKMPFLMDTSDAAERIERGLASNRFEVTFPKRFTYCLKLLRIIPYALYFFVAKGLVR